MHLLSPCSYPFLDLVRVSVCEIFSIYLSIFFCLSVSLCTKICVSVCVSADEPLEALSNDFLTTLE